MWIFWCGAQSPRLCSKTHHHMRVDSLLGDSPDFGELFCRWHYVTYKSSCFLYMAAHFPL